MTNSELYQVLSKRKSVRKYKMNPLPKETLDNIKEFGSGIKPLFPIEIKLEYLSTGDISGMFTHKAPHYVLLYSDQKENDLVNAGYVLEQMDLFLSANGIGACWLGSGKPNDIMDKYGLKFVTMLAFGMSDEPLHRNRISDFKRKSLSQISNCQAGNPILETVHLAPSAVNSQPWYFHIDNSKLIIGRENLNLIKGKVFERMNQIDIGIACTFADISLTEKGHKVSFSINPDHKQYVKAGYKYVISCNFE